MSLTRLRVRTPSPKTVTFSDEAPPTPPKHVKIFLKFKNRAEWERYIDTLLADLQNTVCPGSSITTAGYGSLNGPKSRSSPASDYRQFTSGGEFHSTPKIDSYDTRSGTYGKTQPSTANQKIANNKLTTGGNTNSYDRQQPRATTTGSGGGPYGEKRFNNNLNELDTLLKDLSNGTYANTTEIPIKIEKQNYSYNGSDAGSRSPANYSRPSSAQSTLNRPSVDSLLDELNAGEVIYTGPKKVTITVKETKTEAGYPAETELISTQVTSLRAPAASSATRELEDLMATLSDCKINSGGPQHQTISEFHYARTARASHSTENNLDSMLGNLQADMSRQGVNTDQKGCCGACEKPIVGQVITALGKTWHPEHFTCAHCTQELGTRNFFEREGKPYCEPDYHNLFSPRCAYCNGPILDKCVTALEKTWHMEHFFCAQCGKQFGEEGFHEREGKPYCKDDYFDMFAPKCGACNRAIMENYISALNAQWHPDCFVCRDCKLAVQGKSFYAMEGKPVCPKCIGVDDEDQEEED